MLREIMMKAQIVLLGAEEAKTLLGTEDALKVMDLLFKKGKAGLIAVKDGAKGASVGSPEVFASIPAFPCTCVDPVGAGDAFNAAFLCGILEGKEVEECGRMGGGGRGPCHRDIWGHGRLSFQRTDGGGP